MLAAMALSTSDLYRLAGALVAEHGDAATDFASRAVMLMEHEGNHTRAQFWFVLLMLLDDIQTGRIDPGQHIRIH